MNEAIGRLGGFFVNSFITLSLYLNFCKNVLAKLIRFKLFNPAIFLVFLRQVYFTGVQIMPIFFPISLIIGIALVGLLTKFLVGLGAYEQIGQILTILIIRELAPLLTAVLLSLRSSTAVSAEIAVMNIMREIDTLYAYNIDPVDYLYLPRIVSGLICMFSLATFFSFIAIIGGYFVISFQMNITFDFLLTLIFDYLNFNDIICFLYKTLMLGFFIMSIPIFTSMSVKNANTEIPIALLKGMMRLFYGIIFVEFTGFLI
jgi:phospholipid/cholesterol/gamma-HCH transport system permease protein